MSAICGAISFDRNFNLYEIGSKMLEDLKIYSYDKANEISTEQFYFGCGLQCITSESLHEILPNYNKNKNLLITADAIIDNRDELFELFGIPKASWSLITDSELILMSYERWKSECPKHLLGSFAFAIWDYELKQLFCTRDHVGSRTLYYCFTENTIAFCTLEKPLLKISSGELELNERWITDFFSMEEIISESDTHETIYKGIYQVAPASSLTFGLNGISESRYWDPLKKRKPLKLNSDKEYEEAFLKVFTKAVKSCLRTSSNAGIMLSGGLDSVSVGCVAAQILKEENRNLFSFTSIPMEGFDEKEPEHKIADESKEVKLVLEKYSNIEPKFVRCENRNLLSDIDAAISIFEQPYKVIQNIHWIKEIYERASEKKCKVLLNGHWGNVTISYGRLRVHILTLFRKGKFFTILKEISALKKINNAPAYLLVKDFFKICMPYSLKKALYTLKNKEKDKFSNALVNRDLIKKWDVEKRFDKLDYNVLVSREVDMYDEFKMFYCPNILNHIGTMDSKMSLAHGIVVRDPTRDVRVIEFCLSLPCEQYVKNAIDRNLIRRTMKGIIPEEIRMNLGKRGTQGFDWRKRLELKWDKVNLEIEELLKDIEIKRYIDLDKLKNERDLIGEGLKLENLGEILNIMIAVVFYRFLKSNSNKKRIILK